MILIEVINREVIYYNLPLKKAYTLEFQELDNQSSVQSVEIPRSFRYNHVESLMMKELTLLEEEIAKLMRVQDPSTDEKAELLRKRNNFNYIYNYENTSYE